MAVERKLFGTDGIRGTANIEPMSVDTILRVGRAAACWFRSSNHRRHQVLIGKDPRLSGYMFEMAMASGLCSMGADVTLVGPIPTPGIAFLTSTMRADAGLMISASHNPYIDNGIKFFGPDGFKLPDEVEAKIAKWVFAPDELDRRRPPADEIGKAQRLDDAKGRYIEYLKQNFPKKYSLQGMRIVLDCAHGAAYRIAPTVFSELGATVELLGVDPDGTNINDACGAVYPEAMVEKVQETSADVGIALDGDGDRVIFCDEKSRLFDGDDLLDILAGSLHEQSLLGNGVVGTVMSNFGLERGLKERGIPFFRASVGDRYVVEKMKEKGCALGGEPSGHLVSLARSTTGDGILSALLLLTEVLRKSQPLSTFYGRVQRYPQETRNIPVRKRIAFEKMPPVKKSIQHAETRLNGTGRVLVRYSGTETKARVMVEGEDAKLVSKLADEIASVIEQEIGAS